MSSLFVFHFQVILVDRWGSSLGPVFLLYWKYLTISMRYLQFIVKGQSCDIHINTHIHAIYCSFSLLLIFISVGGQIQNQATPESKKESETTEPTELDPRADPENKEPARTEPESSAGSRNYSYSQIWRSQSQGESEKHSDFFDGLYALHLITDNPHHAIRLLTGS